MPPAIGLPYISAGEHDRHKPGLAFEAASQTPPRVGDDVAPRAPRLSAVRAPAGRLGHTRRGSGGNCIPSLMCHVNNVVFNFTTDQSSLQAQMEYSFTFFQFLFTSLRQRSCVAKEKKEVENLVCVTRNSPLDSWFRKRPRYHIDLFSNCYMCWGDVG